MAAAMCPIFLQMQATAKVHATLNVWLISQGIYDVSDFSMMCTCPEGVDKYIIDPAEAMQTVFSPACYKVATRKLGNACLQSRLRAEAAAAVHVGATGAAVDA